VLQATSDKQTIASQKSEIDALKAALAAKDKDLSSLINFLTTGQGAAPLGGSFGVTEQRVREILGCETTADNQGSASGLQTSAVITPSMPAAQDPLADIPQNPWSGSITSLGQVWGEFSSGGKRGTMPPLRELCLKVGWDWLRKQKASPPNVSRLKSVVREIWNRRDRIMLATGMALASYEEAEELAYTEMLQECEAWLRGEGKMGHSHWFRATLIADTQKSERTKYIQEREAQLGAGHARTPLLEYLSLP
jgi:hypothetical protein